jgi:toxin-antitoxin system PIN domain toxin
VFYAHRAESTHHQASLHWLEELLSSGDAFAVPDPVLAAVVRLATNPRWLDKPSTHEQVFTFCSEVRSAPGWVDLSPGPRHWEIFERLCTTANARGDLVPDAFLAALAIENDCEFVTFDRGFRRFPGLRFSLPS